jgi:hypothetical protein
MTIASRELIMSVMTSCSIRSMLILSAISRRMRVAFIGIALWRSSTKTTVVRSSGSYRAGAFGCPKAR